MRRAPSCGVGDKVQPESAEKKDEEEEEGKEELRVSGGGWS